jgi:sensitive to high expression protein 9
LNVVKQRIREWSEQAAITVRTRADDFTASTRSTLSQLGLHLNKVTGYEAIEALKRDVVDQGAYIHCVLYTLGSEDNPKKLFNSQRLV